MFGKLLALLSIGGTISGINLTEKFITAFVLVLGLAVTAAIIAGSLTVFALYGIHVALIRHGLDPDIAALYTALIGLLTLAAIIGAILYKLKRMQLPSFGVSNAGAVGTIAVKALHGFYRGLTDKKS